MKVDWENIWISVKRNKNILLIIVGIIVLLLLFGYLFTSCGNWFDERFIRKTEENINAAQNVANQINGNLANLSIENAIKANEVERQAIEHNAAKNASNQAQTQTNDALGNVDAVENGNFTNSSMDSANRARCKAFPNSEGCR